MHIAPLESHPLARLVQGRLNAKRTQTVECLVWLSAFFQFEKMCPNSFRNLDSAAAAMCVCVCVLLFAFAGMAIIINWLN